MPTTTSLFNTIVKYGAGTQMTDLEFIKREIDKWRNSDKRKLQVAGDNYYSGEHDILKRQRTIIGKDGVIQVVENLPNNKIIDNQYAKLVEQKANYLLGKPITIDTPNARYALALKDVFNKRFARTLKNLGRDSLNGGIGWLHPHYNERGELCFKRFDSHEILPFWADSDHTILDCAVRLYSVEGYDGTTEKKIEKVEIYSANGVQRYVLSQNGLIPDVENPSSAYMTVTDSDGKQTDYNWDSKIPLIAFKYNAKEIPLIKKVKSLQDGINTILSDFENNMQEDARNTILVIHNYDGQDLSEFRYNLAAYGAVKVKTVDGSAGKVETLQVAVNAENYKAILELFKKALIENAMGYDAKDDRLSGNPNQMNIQSMYSDIDLDANGMETEFQASFEELLWFINTHLSNAGQGNYATEEVNIIFNRDILINETESITNCKASVGIISNETIIGQHPWIDDVEQEKERLKKEKQQLMEEYSEYKEAFGADGDNHAAEE